MGVLPSPGELRAGAITDLPQGLPTRDDVAHRLFTETPVTARHVLAVDLDGFLAVNEAVGEAGGDELLEQIVVRLRAALGIDDVIGRGAGDDLVVVIANEDPSEVDRRVERLLACIREPLEVAGQRFLLTASIGIAAVDAPDAPNDPLRAADSAMQRARASGGSGSAWYDATVAAEVAERLRLAGELRVALEREQFVLHYQPAYELATGRCIGIEALIRWDHPERGLVPPGQFLPTAASTGLLEPIGAWALTMAAHHLREIPNLDDSNGRGVPLKLWVNVSLGQVDRPGFASWVLEQLAEADVDPRRFGLEVTEEAVAEASGVAVAELEHLRRVGIGIALDDFGTGFSSLSRLRALPIDVVKIDRSFVADLPTRAGRAILAAIIDLAHAIDATALAEGVESQEELDELRRMGCDAVSGFLLARPVPMSELPTAAQQGVATLRVTIGTPAADGRRVPVRKGRLRLLRAAKASDAVSVAEDVDAVTGLGNHRALRRDVQALLARGKRPILLVVDLDGFRAFGLLHDRESADMLLRAQCRRLQAIEGTTAYRIGGDVFAVVLEDRRRGVVSSQLDLDALARGPKGTTACVGIAHAGATSTVDELEQRAQEALKVAKRRGFGAVVDGEAISTETPPVTSSQARALFAVLREGYLRVHYQPIFCLTDGSVMGYEALVRPQFDHGLTGPQEAFHVASQLGLVPELDAVCRASIFSDGPGFDMAAGSRLFVNIAPEALGHRSLRKIEVARQIKGAGLDLRRVVFELHESPAIDPSVFIEEALHIVDRGFAVALDDAGGAAANLQAMRAVPFSFLKLAPELLVGARTDPTTAATLDALCSFAQHTSTQVIATGVESPKLLAIARGLRGSGGGEPRIHAAQGYHLGKPQPQARARSVT